MSAPRVLHVAQPSDGGVATYVDLLARDQHRRGWPVAVACGATGQLGAALASGGVTVHDWPANRSPWRGLPGERRALAAVIRRFDPDVVHLHSSKAGLVGRLLLRGSRPTIFQPHAWSWLAVSGPVSAASRTWERRAARWTDAIVCVSQSECALGEKARVKADLRVVRHGIDTELFRTVDATDAQRAREVLQLPPGPIAVCVGRISRQKGQDRLLDLWPRVRERVPDATLVLVGDGELPAEGRVGLPSGVLLVGAAADVWSWYAAADVVVSPSRWEGMSLVLLEAGACGRSVVATDVDGVREALAAVPDAIVSLGDDAGFVTAIAARLASSDLRAVEGAALAEHVRRNFRLHDMLDNLAELTRTVAAGHDVRRR